ncbi:hypothetical protein LPJ56_006970, partial [Coemansia sp. RSA 2599]
MDNLREGRRKFSLGINTLGSESTTSLPLRAPRTTAAQTFATIPMTAPTEVNELSSAPKVDILVTGAKAF